MRREVADACNLSLCDIICFCRLNSYQMMMRSSSGRNIAPSVMPNAL